MRRDLLGVTPRGREQLLRRMTGGGARLPGASRCDGRGDGGTRPRTIEVVAHELDHQEILALVRGPGEHRALPGGRGIATVEITVDGRHVVLVVLHRVS